MCSSDLGTTGRPAKAHNTLQGNFAKDQALQAWRGSPCLVTPREGFLPWRGTSPREGIKPKAWRGLQPREGFFLAKGALSPRRSAHGLCVLRRVPDAPKRDDDSVVVVVEKHRRDFLLLLVASFMCLDFFMMFGTSSIVTCDKVCCRSLPHPPSTRPHHQLTCASSLIPLGVQVQCLVSDMW